MKAFKGFDENLQCRGFQYEVGKTYTEDCIEICQKGFHAIGEDESPLNVFDYYPPAEYGKPSRYCEVEAEGEVHRKEEKICCSKLTVGAEIGIPGLVKAHVEWVKKHITNENNAEPGKPATAGYSGAATAGDSGAATAGDSGAATAGYRGAATAGYRGAATAGEYGAATAGYSGAATAGDSGAATAGYRGAATAGYRGAATSRGSASVGKNGVAVARHENAKVRGGIGALLVVAVENDDNFNIKEWKAVVVDGETVKADTWYTVRDGELVEVGG